MKIPVKEAIISGDWLQCSYTFLGPDMIVLRFKPISFEKIDLHKIDDPLEMKIDQGVLWLLKVECVNISKAPIDAFHGQSISITDNDDFTFDAAEDYHLTRGSKYATSTNLSRFAGELYSKSQVLSPKIKTIGAIAYLLPDDDQAEYFFSSKWGGSIQAV